MTLKDKMRTVLLDFLQIQPAQNQRVTLQESVGFATDIIQNKIWYRGDPSELSQFYKQLGSGTADDTFSTRFWAQVPEVGSIRKAHDGIPAVMVDTLSQIVKADLDDFDFSDDSEAADRWEEISEENEFTALTGQAITDTLVTGDGAFKISIDPDVSQHPILEFWAADRVEYEIIRGRINAILFVSQHGDEKNRYTLRERYAKGSVSYELYNKDGNACELSTLPELAHLENISFDGDFMMAVPLRFFKSTRWPNRGRSIYSSKMDSFDILDEIISQWLDAIRAGRVMRYIPENLVPRNAENGALTGLSFFQSNFIITETDNHESAQSKVDMQQAEIRYDAFLSSYSSALDRCLHGIMSPATLGIDLGKMASADAQREKKDVTGYTRNAITDALEKALPQVVSVMLMTDDLMQELTPGQYDPTISFGEYGAPDFDSRITTLSKAATANLMSIEAGVDELWGSSKDDSWKEKEVQRIKQLRGIEIEEEPAVGDELNADMEAAGGIVRADGNGADLQPAAESNAAQVVGEAGRIPVASMAGAQTPRNGKV